MKFFRKSRDINTSGQPSRLPDGARRRPLTPTPGVYRPQVFSYHSSRSADNGSLRRLTLPETQAAQNPDSNSKMKRRFVLHAIKNRVVVIIVIIFCLAVFISQLGLSSTPKIVTVSDGGGSVFLHTSDIYKNAASSIIGKSFMGRNKLLIDTGAIANQLENKFPELDAVTVTVPMIGHQSTVYLQPAKPSFELFSTSGNFVIDTHGRALARVSDSMNIESLHIPLVTAANGLQPKLGRAALSSGDVLFLRTILGQLNAQHIGIKQVVIPPAASEIDVYIAGNPFFIKFNMQDQAGALQQVGAFVATTKQLAAQGKMPKEYIDVRVDGRVYYK